MDDFTLERRWLRHVPGTMAGPFSFRPGFGAVAVSISLPAGSLLSPRLSLCRSGHNDRLFASNPGEHRAFDPRRIAGHPSEGDSIAEQFFVGFDRAT